MKTFFIGFIALITQFILLQTSFANDNLALLGKIPVQQGGRIKPLDTLARDTVLLIAEKRSLRGDYAKLTAMEAILEWLNDGRGWSQKKIIYVGRQDVRQRLGLKADETVFSPAEISELPAMNREWENIQKKQSQGTKLDNTEQALSRVFLKLETFQAVATGAIWAIIPQPSGKWTTISDERAQKTGIPQLLSQYLDCHFAKQNTCEAGAVQQITQEIISRQAVELLKIEKEKQAHPEAVEGNPQSLAEMAKAMNREYFFNELQPFHKSWITYLLAFFLFLIYFGIRKTPMLVLAWLTYFVAFGLHTYGFVLRCLLTGRPPVTNMYESTIWVPWGIVIFSFMITLISRKFKQKHVIAAAATAVTALSLLLSDNVPAVLDPTIRPLEPVLRSNYWLTIHVLTITLSYGAFALSMAIGNIILGLYAFQPHKTENISTYTQFMYRAVQFGVVLLAAGTILGGVWADYSWGRFWGWDPKETWALIALLMYIGILHGKWAGWLRQFGLVLGSVLCFMGVLMAWYGVNFVLGVGLHSYGFTSGGLEFLAVYVAIQLSFVAFVWLKHFNKRAK